MTARPQPASSIVGLVMDEAALAYARKWKLVRQDGTVKCSREHCNGDATLPTLECNACRDRRLGT